MARLTKHNQDLSKDNERLSDYSTGIEEKLERTETELAEMQKLVKMMEEQRESKKDTAQAPKANPRWLSCTWYQVLLIFAAVCLSAYLACCCCSRKISTTSRNAPVDPLPAYLLKDNQSLTAIANATQGVDLEANDRERFQSARSEVVICESTLIPALNTSLLDTRTTLRSLKKEKYTCVLFERFQANIEASKKIAEEIHSRTGTAIDHLRGLSNACAAGAADANRRAQEVDDGVGWIPENRWLKAKFGWNTTSVVDRKAAEQHTQWMLGNFTVRLDNVVEMLEEKNTRFASNFKQDIIEITGNAKGAKGWAEEVCVHKELRYV